MATDNNTQSLKTGDIREKRQVDDKPKGMRNASRKRSGENTIAFWRSRLFRNSYTAKDGSSREIPEWYVRLRFAGATKRVRLKTAEREQAAEQARALNLRLQAEGWPAVLEGQARLPTSPTIDEICTAYSEMVPTLATPPRPISVVNYVRCLRQFAKLAGASQLRELTAEAIEKARERYREVGHKAERPEHSVKNSFAKIIRNAAAIFSRESREAFARRGLKLEANPFDGVKRQQEIRRFRPLSPALLQRIMREAPKLLTGDPSAKDPTKTPFAKAHLKRVGRFPQWRTTDFRRPQPDAYAALLLAFSCGMRAKEIDWARWDWITEVGGRTFIEIPAVGGSERFASKSGAGRTIPLQPEVLEELRKARHEFSPFIVGGKEPEMGSKAANGLEYRSPETFRSVNLWLREQGVEEGRERGHPLHTLRKQYGSHVATNFGLFHAQVILGHSDPKITRDYYASPTDLPNVMNFRAG